MQQDKNMFLQLVSIANDAKEAAAAGTPAGEKKAGLNADEMGEVVGQVQQRWMGAIDKEDPEIVDEFLRNMKSAISEIHIKEGYPQGKVYRPSGDDWLTKIVVANKKMQDMIEQPEKVDRVAAYDS